MSTQLNDFVGLLKEIFQYDQADLDFGIYRIMNKKREEINLFLEKDLVPQVKKSFEKYKKTDLEAIKKELASLEEKLVEMGVPKEKSDKYQELHQKFEKGIDTVSLENEVYSDLTNFFKRYYDEGDFMSKRRYKKDVYAIPYEGEEVKLHWANADQYYIKTSENFKDYSFVLPSGKKVHFKLIEAETEQDNNKVQEGKERRFILKEQDFINEINNELFVYFEYKVDSQNRRREKINTETVEKIFSNEDFHEWLGELQTVTPTESNKNRTLLEKQLNDYTIKNTSDYYIHKNLGDFLKRELDFYIKNEIMHLDDLDTENELKFEQYISKIKVIKSIGNKIIQFLELIENFQRKIWLKKKFVVESNYCITLDRIPKSLYDEIANNMQQIEEWKALYAIDEVEGFSLPVSINFLSDNPYLLIDTKNFKQEFTYKLLSEIDNLDENTSGLLINSENFQALNLLQNKYSKTVKGIYIDPPYNAKSSEILYKNTFKHSAWLSLMENRLSIAKNLLDDDGSVVVAIDENEQESLGLLLNNIFPTYEKSTISVVHNPAGVQGKNFSYSHEYSIFMFPKNGEYIGYTLRDDDLVSPLKDWGGTSARNLAKTCFYPIIVKGEEIVGYGDVCNDDFHPTAPNITEDGLTYVYPIDRNGVERKWVFSRNSVEKNSNQLFVKIQDGETVIMRRKSFRKYRTVWDDKRYYANIYGSKLLSNIFGTLPFSFPKSIHTVEDSLKALIPLSKPNALAIDFFAGSGTTGHAVINLNREDDGDRKYILVEMGDYFETVTKPRIQKVIYSKDWKNGKPVSREGSSHMFKYMHLESYEDSLNNIELSRNVQQEMALKESMSQTAKEEYLLSYMLDIEAEGSASLLNIDQLKNPFEYKMKIAIGNEIKERNIDLIETFNYLIGLKVEKLSFINHHYIILGEMKNGEKTLVIWRNLNESTNEELEKLFVENDYNSLEMNINRIYVNGDNHLGNLKTAESTWEVSLIEDEIKQLMFDMKSM